MFWTMVSYSAPIRSVDSAELSKIAAGGGCSCGTAGGEVVTGAGDGVVTGVGFGADTVVGLGADIGAAVDVVL